MDDVVATTGGKVRGTRLAEGVRAFRGIPFAAPPFGALRLRAPQPAPPWDGVRAADAYGPVPPQPIRELSISGAPAPKLNFGEDILTANVFVPEDGGTGLPVFVYIYGGAYTQGFADSYDPSELVRAGLVAVTFNYRVGFEGFGHAPGAPDNRGLLDQVAALRWVRENIAAFGGDPDNVTVAGESAGAGSVAALYAMPAAQGLFRRAIAHSVPCEFISLERATETGARIAELAGVPATVDALASVPPDQLIDAGARLLTEFQGDPDAGIRNYLVTVYSPVIDGEVLPVNPLDALRAAAGPDLLLLHTTEEFRLFTTLGLAPVPKTEEDLATAAAAFGMTRFAEYRAAQPDLAVVDLYAQFVTDFLFGEYTTRLAEAGAAAGGTVYLARFAWRSPAFGGALGACHALDLPFSFGLTAETPVAMFTGGANGPAERALSDRMLRAWVDFAATGDPGWPAATPGTLPVKVWNTEDQLITDTGDGLRALWRDFRY